MDFRGKKLEDLVVTLSFHDGSTADYGVYKYFRFKGKEYFAMLPVNAEKELDHSKKCVLYEVQEDAEHNPIVVYIEDDKEYEEAAAYYSTLNKTL